MNCYQEIRVLVICCVLIAAVPTGIYGGSNEEIKSEEVEIEDIFNITTNNLSNDSSIEIGVLDSHEAMNNRDAVKSKSREKRSYKFLLGLINNNSRYEITKTDPSEKVDANEMHKHKDMQRSSGKPLNIEDSDSNISASELLLELMVRIAAHPDQWDKVHNLLQKIDHDLQTSKKLLDNLETAEVQKNETKSESEIENNVVIKKDEPTTKIINKTNENWPKFDDNSNTNVNTATTETRWSTHKSIYPKTFAYHRVTGRPLYLNKNPKAYIAVSIIAPKPLVHTKNEDLNLEKELRQLKPWTHQQNLKNMENLRSRWVIESSEQKKYNNAS